MQDIKLQLNIAVVKNEVAIMRYSHDKIGQSLTYKVIVGHKFRITRKGVLILQLWEKAVIVRYSHKLHFEIESHNCEKQIQIWDIKLHCEICEK